MRQVASMPVTASIGLMAGFAVDFADMAFIAGLVMPALKLACTERILTLLGVQGGGLGLAMC